MKLLTYAMAALACATLATSCSSDEPLAGGQDGNVTFTVQLPQELASRAGTPTFGNGLKSQNLTAVAYFQGTTTIADIQSKSFGGGLTTTVSFNLANGQDYDIVFWAADGTCAYTLDTSNATVTLDATKLAANVESQDAFFAKESLTTNGQGLNRTVKLYRPFAQLNLGTSDLNSNAVKGNTTVTPNITGAYQGGVYTTVSAKAYNSLNLLNNQMGTLTAVEFPAVVANPTGETFPVSGYDYLSMVYLLVDTKTAEDVTFNFYDGDPKAATPGTKKHTLTVPNTPLERNYQTNIYGALLTTTAEYTVEIVPTFDKPANDNMVWNGSAKMPDFSNVSWGGSYPNYTITGEVNINSPEEFAGLVGVFNGTLPMPTVNGQAMPDRVLRPMNEERIVYNLNCDINLLGRNFPQINQFHGTFNGNGHTISNFVIEQTEEGAGLFSSAYQANGGNIESYPLIKDLVISAATVTSTSTKGNVGVIVGKTTGMNIQNCTVKNCTVNAARTVGAIAGYFYGHINGCTAENNTINCLKAQDGAEGKDAGGIIGWIGENTNYMTGTITNNKVIGGTINGFTRLGGVIGTVRFNTVFTGNTVEQYDGVNLIINKQQFNGAYGDQFGALWGRNVLDDGTPTQQGHPDADNVSDYVTIQ